MKEFSKLSMLKKFGIINKDLDGDIFRTSWSIQLKTFLYYLNYSVVSLKFVMASFFDRNNKIQLFFGSYFNYLESDTR